jgi:hypothetical protein
MKLHRRERIRIRFANLTSTIVENMKQEFGVKEIMTNERRAKNKNNLVALLDLNSSFDCDKLYKFIAQYGISRKNYMIRVSIVTEQYSDGIRVPKKILRLMCRLDCGLIFSFTKI